MGLMDWFTKEGKFKRMLRKASDRDQVDEDREAAVYFLHEDGSPQALFGLLKRFDVNLSQSLKDKKEKELVFELLVSHGDDVKEPLRQWMGKCQQYAWPLKLKLALEGEDAACQTVFELLEGAPGKDAWDASRRKELLVWLTEQKHEGIVAAATPFLDDFDEEVRYAAAEAIIAQESDDGREPLLGLLSKADEESIRLKHRLATIFRTRGWSVGEALSGEALPDGFTVQGGRVVGG